jgi:enhancing lycopene biosynthesis protein 2
MAKKIGVLLSGCGVFDGAEIHEAVLTLLVSGPSGGIDTVHGSGYVDQLHVIDHLTQQPADERRNVLVESARIASGEIQDVSTVVADDIDALIIPGGFGAAKNFSDFAVKGPEAQVHPHVQRLLVAMIEQLKTDWCDLHRSGNGCSRPVRSQSPRVTIGNDVGTAAAISIHGGEHCICSVEDICVDVKNRIVTTPAYMLGPGIKDVAIGIEKLVDKVLSLC